LSAEHLRQLRHGIPTSGWLIPLLRNQGDVIKGLVIGGTHSGSGKSTATLGLLAALHRRGLKVAPFKVGPDFIDPGHHSAIAGAVSHNLDGWMLDRQTNSTIFSRCSRDADMAVVEGVMGLFDGYDGKTESGSTAQMAKWLGLPVLLVVDARSMARSAAAVVQGFENFDPDLEFAGVIFNNLGSPRHLQYLKDALADHVRTPCVGGLFRNADICIPERHLGLVTRQDHPLTDEMKSSLAELIESGLELDRLLSRINDCRPGNGATLPYHSGSERSVRIGVARDNAFCFYYEHNFELLNRFGATLVEFSPTADGHLPEALDGLYLGGGYPELYADRLSENRSMRTEIQAFSRGGMPIYAECGGFMYLCDNLSDLQGNRYAMANCFPFSTRMLPRRKALGYREVELTGQTLLGKAGQRLRGHEFHYSEITHVSDSIPTMYKVAARIGNRHTVEGYQVQNTLGSYIHLHFGSQPDAARDFVKAARHFQKERTQHP